MSKIIFTIGAASLLIAVAGTVIPKAIGQAAHDSVNHGENLK